MYLSHRAQLSLWNEVCPLTHCYSDDLLLFEYGCSESKRALAVALNGVTFQNANQKNDDPIFPQGLGDVSDQPLDKCLGHNQRNSPSGMYHYHSFSPCLNKGFLAEHGPQDDCRCGPCEDDPIGWALSGYAAAPWNNKTVIGISKDGRVLYGPYNDDREAW